MVFLAASTLDKLKDIPTDVWLKLAAAVLIMIVAIIVLRKIAKMNKLILGIIVMLTISFVGFSWIYERNEPAFLTPVVEKLAPFFPSKNGYTSKQKTNPKGTGAP
jgi:hypothetical protein